MVRGKKKIEKLVSVKKTISKDGGTKTIRKDFEDFGKIGIDPELAQQFLCNM